MQTKLVAQLAVVITLIFAPAARAQNNAQAPKSDKSAAAAPSSETQDKNIQEYVELLRSNVRQDKAELMGSVMQLSADDAAKFWPIYAEYDAELTKVNDQRVANIEEYSRSYNDLTDEKADELVQRAMQYIKNRGQSYWQNTTTK